MTLRVLIVDDQRDSADSLAALLRLWGYDARSAYNAEHAYHHATSWHPDIALIDLVLPGEDGISLAERLRRLDCCKDTVLVALTAMTGRTIRELAMEAFDDYLIKPCDHGLLRCRLLNLAKARAQRSHQAV